MHTPPRGDEIIQRWLHHPRSLWNGQPDWRLPWSSTIVQPRVVETSDACMMEGGGWWGLWGCWWWWWRLWHQDLDFQILDIKGFSRKLSKYMSLFNSMEVLFFIMGEFHEIKEEENRIWWAEKLPSPLPPFKIHGRDCWSWTSGGPNPIEGRGLPGILSPSWDNTIYCSQHGFFCLCFCLPHHYHWRMRGKNRRRWGRKQHDSRRSLISFKEV